jgi:cobalt/nickel transport system permease protein
MWAVTAIVVAFAIRQTDKSLDERAIPLMGVTAAFIFAGQMVNFPVAPGTSGHLLGGVLAAVLLGPWAGTLVMTAVVTVQALLFQDGGLIVLGANIFIMGIVGTLGAYAAYRLLARILGGEARGRVPAAAVAAWLAVMGGALSIGLMLLASNATTVEVMGVILGVHALIGIGEAAITIAALVFIQATRPDLFRLRDAFDPMRVRAAQGA